MSPKYVVDKKHWKKCKTRKIQNLYSFLPIFATFFEHIQSNLESAQNSALFDTPLGFLERIFLRVIVALFANFQYICLKNEIFSDI
jgi:hypothetical protein